MPQNRFGLCPLYTDNANNAVNDEMLIDSRTGDTALKRSDGKIIQVNNIFRLYNHKSTFINHITCNGLVDSDIYLLEFDDSATSKQIVPSSNILDSSIDLSNGKNTKISRFSISLDLDILMPDDNDRMMSSNVIPIVEVSYNTSSISKIQQIPFYKLPTQVFPIDEMSFSISSIRLIVDSSVDLSKLDIILHSILVAHN